MPKLKMIRDIETKSLEELIACCFWTGPSFGGHTNDEDRAFEVLTELRKRDVTYLDAETLARQHLGSRKLPLHLIQAELKRFRIAMRPWLGGQ